MRHLAPPLFRDMITVIDRLPTKEECVRTRHLILQQTKKTTITDDDLATVLSSCPYLESVKLCGMQDTTNRSIVALAMTSSNLQGIDLTGCEQVTDVGVLDLVAKSLPLQWIRLNGVVGLTDPSISAIGRSCSRLVEIELCDLPLVTALSVRDLWSFSRKLRILRLAGCPLLTDKAFPSPVRWSSSIEAETDKPLPPNPSTWPDKLPALVLRQNAENLRVLDVGNCTKLTDEAIEGIVSHAPKMQTLVLSGCSLLTNRAIESICKLGDNLDVLMLAHIGNITDPAMVKLVRSCMNLRTIDLACTFPPFDCLSSCRLSNHTPVCRQLTDMSIFELAGLNSLRRLSVVRIHKLTDNAIFFLAEHATSLEHLCLSYCDRISLEAVSLLLNKVESLQYLSVSGVRSFRRLGVERFSDRPPSVRVFTRFSKEVNLINYES